MPSPSVSIAARLIIRGALLVMTCGVQYGFSYQISSVMFEPEADQIDLAVLVHVGGDDLVAAAKARGDHVRVERRRRIGRQHGGGRRGSLAPAGGAVAGGAPGASVAGACMPQTVRPSDHTVTATRVNGFTRMRPPVNRRSQDFTRER